MFSCSVVPELFATPGTAALPGFPYHHQLPELAQTQIHWFEWCHPTISSSVVPFSSCPQSFPAKESFPMNLLFSSGGQSIGASASVLPMNIQGWFPLELISFRIWSPCSPRDSQESSPTPQFKSINSSALNLLYGLNSHISTRLLEKPYLWL